MGEITHTSEIKESISKHYFGEKKGQKKIDLYVQTSIFKGKDEWRILDFGADLVEVYRYKSGKKMGTSRMGKTFFNWKDLIKHYKTISDYLLSGVIDEHKSNLFLLSAKKQLNEKLIVESVVKNCDINKKFLDSLDKILLSKLYSNISKNYDGMSNEEIKDELFDIDAENVMDYVTGNFKTVLYHKYKKFLLKNESSKPTIKVEGSTIIFENGDSVEIDYDGEFYFDDVWHDVRSDEFRKNFNLDIEGELNLVDILNVASNNYNNLPPMVKEFNDKNKTIRKNPLSAGLMQEFLMLDNIDELLNYSRVISVLTVLQAMLTNNNDTYQHNLINIRNTVMNALRIKLGKDFDDLVFKYKS